MEIQEFLEKKKQIQKVFLEFINNEDDYEENYQNLMMMIIKNQNIRENKYELKEFLHLLLKISNNHYRNKDFFSKYEQILTQFKDDMIKNFSNLELFDIFKRNKRILLFLIEEKIINIDQSIVNVLTNDKYSEMGYSKYFFNDIKNFIDDELREKIFNSIKNQEDSFDENRKIGENETKICQLIRKDLIDEFISFVNQNSLSLMMKIELSIFETNRFIIKRKNPSLIEYAAFFGSIQIFRYLYLNKVELTQSLWLYAIHGRNPEIIHILEEKQIVPSDVSYFECFDECIKCHHNEIADYIKLNIIDPKNEIEDEYDFFSSSIKSYNYAFIPTDLIILWLFMICVNMIIYQLLKCFS